MKIKRLGILALVVIAFASINSSCGGGSSSESAASMDVSHEIAVEGMNAEYAKDDRNRQQLNDEGEKGKVAERKLIKEGDLRFETGDLAATHKRLLEISNQFDGYVSVDELYKEYNRRTHRLQLRIPAEDFDAVVAAIGEGVEHFDRKEIRVKDVTEEFLDVEARLKAKKTLEARYLELLKKANTVKDMLEIERQLADVREEIESFEGRLKYLQNRISLATIDINFYQTIPGSEDKGYKPQFGRAFRNGWENLLRFAVGLTSTWPFLLIIAAVGLFASRALARRQRKK